MNNHRLRALIVRLQDRLSEDDRKRLHFFLGNDVPRRIRDDPSLGGTLSLMESLFDQDKINDDDFTFLINAFDEIQCLDAVYLLREHMKQMQSQGINDSVQSLSLLMPSLIDMLSNDQEDKLALEMPLINKETYSNNNNIIINSNNKTISVGTHVNDNETKLLPAATRKQFSMATLLKRTICLILFMVLSIVLISGVVWIIHLNKKCKSVVNDEEKNHTIVNAVTKKLLLSISESLHRVEDSLSNTTTVNFTQLFKQLSTSVTDLEDDLKYLEGKTCGCAKWCNDHGSQYGVCGAGNTCICEQHIISKEDVDDRCRCDRWCKNRNYKNGGICGDGYTCICSP